MQLLAEISAMGVTRIRRSAHRLQLGRHVLHFIKQAQPRYISEHLFYWKASGRPENVINSGYGQQIAEALQNQSKCLCRLQSAMDM